MRSAWSGWVAFAAWFILITGCIAVFQGLIAIIREHYYTVTPNQVVVFSVKEWGWITLIWGIVYALVGLSLLGGASWARWVAIVLGSLLSVAAILLQETTHLRVESTRDLLRLIGAAFVENLLYHQLHLLWRIGGTFDYLVRRRTDLGLMVRYGSFQR